jgi:hypothetical protein
MFAKYKPHNNSLYNKLVELSRNIFFYEKLLLKDDFLTRINLIFLHLSILLVIFKEKNNDKFPQDVFDNIFLNIEYHLRELGHGDVVVNKKMKLLTQKFYDILIKIKNKDTQHETINKTILEKHLELVNTNKDENLDKLAVYFDDFYNFCFELNNNSVLKGVINFKY